MRHRTFVAVWIGLVTCSIQLADAIPPQLPGWDVSWFDEFDGTSVHTGLWNVIFSTNPTNNSLHAYLPSQVSVSDGNLVITSTNQSYNGLPYRSGQVISKNQQRFGKWEVRAKLPTSKGQWPAIWLLPQTQSHPWPSQGEIDIMENRGDEPHKTSSAFHYGSNPPFNHQFVYSEQSAQVGGQSTNYHDSFHNYGVEWSEDVLRFFVDGVNHYNVHNEDVGGFLSSQTASMETVINNAIGGHFLANPDNTTVWPQQMLIDYVHVYQHAATAADLTHNNGSFEGGPSPLAEWTTFGVRDFGNVAPHNEAVRSGSHSLKLFGQFNGNNNYSGVEQGITVTGGEEVRAIIHNFIRSADSIAGTDNQVQLKIDYYNQRHGKFGSSDYISSDSIVIANGSTQNDVWLENELRSVAPAGAVEARMALVFNQPSNMNGAVHIDDTVFGRRGDNVLTWDGNGNGNWINARWQGVGPAYPSDFDAAVIRNDRVLVANSQAAHETRVESGALEIAAQLTGDVDIQEDGSILNRGSLVGDLTISGAMLVESTNTLIVSGDVEFINADLLISAAFMPPRGTYTGDFVLIDADQVSGSLAADAGEHLGDGVFLNHVESVGSQVTIDLYSALEGDANGDGIVDGLDIILWNENKFQSGTDWTTGDFNGDGTTDGSDFILWNENKFTSARDATYAVPEPGLAMMSLLLAAYCMRLRR